MMQDLQRSKREQIMHCHGDISRMLDTVELICLEERRAECPSQGCPFNPDGAGCRIGKMRALTGPTLPIGICESGEVDGKEILCRLAGSCDFQLVDPDDSARYFCGREDALLPEAEQGRDNDN